MSPANDEEIFATSDGSTRAVLTSDPGHLCEQLDKAPAIATMLFTGLFAEAGTVNERLAALVQRSRDERSRRFGTGVFLFFEANGEAAPITPRVQHDWGDFVVALDGLPKQDIRDRHEPLARKILTAIGLAMPSVRGFEKVGRATVFFADDGKPIYRFNVEGGRGAVWQSHRPATEDLAATRRLASRMAMDTSLDRVIRLLNESLDPNQEKLRRFLAPWMALEVFVNKNFAAYQRRFWDSLSAAVSQPIRDRYLKRIHEVMGDKHKPLDKFVIVAAELDPGEAEGDIAIFQRSKVLRDEFLHGETVNENDLPVEEIEGLIRKLLRLHVNCH